MDGSELSRSLLRLPDHRNNWPDHLRPFGEGGADKESFSNWWSRNREELAHLPPDLCEQWIFRHWQHSPFTFLSLGGLSWERRTYDGDDLLRSVYRAFGGDLEPQFDYEAFQRGGWCQPTSDCSGPGQRNVGLPNDFALNAGRDH